MTRQQFLSGDYNHPMVVEELERSVKNQINNEIVTEMAFKIVSINSNDGVYVIVLVTDFSKGIDKEGKPLYSLYGMHFKMKKDWEQWEDNILTNGTYVDENIVRDTLDFKKFVMEDKLTPEEASKKCFKKFLYEICRFDQERLVRTY